MLDSMNPPLVKRPTFVLILCLASAHVAAQQEVAVPDFDSKKIEASYVLAVPPKHSPKKETPLILDFHGACHPATKGANRT